MIVVLSAVEDATCLDENGGVLLKSDVFLAFWTHLFQVAAPAALLAEVV